MSWSVSQAKARLSEVLSHARKAPQVILPMRTWLDWVDHLKADADLEFALPERRLDPERSSPFGE